MANPSDVEKTRIPLVDLGDYLDDHNLRIVRCFWKEGAPAPVVHLVPRALPESSPSPQEHKP